MLPFLPMYIHLVLSALLPIVTGSLASLSRPSSAAKSVPRSRQEHNKDDDDDDEDEEPQKMEGLTPSDAIVFPLTAGAVLAGLYFLIQRYGAVVINFILGWYFALVGVYSVSLFINDALTIAWDLVLPDFYVDQGKVWRVSTLDRKTEVLGESRGSRSSPLPGPLGRVPIPKLARDFLWRQRGALKTKYLVKCDARKPSVDFKATLTRHNVFCAVLGAVVVVSANTVVKAWYLTNLQGFAVSYGALQLMSPTSFGTGSLILSALFVYDVWAVFFTPLMVTVAKNLDVPIKLVFPRPDDARSFSMLGLGDIVIPGIMIAMALRFDLYLFYLKKQTYFRASLCGYVAGMIATLVAMNVSDHPQPALLYLVPGVLTSLWTASLVRGELKLMWEFSEGIDLEEDHNSKSNEAKTSDKEKVSSDQSSGWWSWLTGTTSASKLDEVEKKAASGKDENGSADSKSEAEVKKIDESPDSGPSKATKSVKDDLVFSFTVTLARPKARAHTETPR
ncbi:uncharacterized protein K489DRAFT_310948 [Dissoconium aciculare CBS 342.82]|uniref:Peptidase A22B, signal peptide peptidase n=1 Tax=Dissoconium aciculare CBS 342.82 TaxID=1314786 RepID=A0A6J3MLR9_9PEZI|nr:uncharacterized protein K489DRAFT_310948 [Dissoconium aciculare CBS 342.82]KAF1827932.1 hypothetical protein K489DRAFT_310948 [Dissoconium aciculare CBS 342.82]